MASMLHSSVIFGVAVFLHRLQSPLRSQTDPFYAAGDIAQCTFNGIDITFFVSYLKGGRPRSSSARTARRYSNSSC
jgi:hypothetical protein